MRDASGRSAAVLLRAFVGTVGYAIVGYPAIMALRARLRPHGIVSDDRTPTVTLIVPCHNEADVIVQKIDDLRRLDYPPGALRIVIVDDGSTDGTATLARTAAAAPGHPVTIVERPERRGKAEAINVAVESSDSEVIALSDATAMWDVDALRRLVGPFGDRDVAVASGRMRYRASGTGTTGNLYWRYQDAIRHWESATGSTVGVNGNVFAIRRECFSPLPPGTVNDELTLALQAAIAGGRVVFEPDARAVDVPSSTMRVERQRRARMVAGRFFVVAGPASGIWRRPGLAARYVSHKLLRPFVPVAASGALAASVGVVVRPARRPVVDRLIAWTVLLAVGGVAGLATEGRRRDRLGRHAPIVVRAGHFVVSSSIASVVGIARGVSGRQGVLWVKRPPESAPTAGHRTSLEPERHGDDAHHPS